MVVEAAGAVVLLQLAATNISGCLGSKQREKGRLALVQLGVTCTPADRAEAARPAAQPYSHRTAPVAWPRISSVIAAGRTAAVVAVEASASRERPSMDAVRAAARRRAIFM